MLVTFDSRPKRENERDEKNNKALDKVLKSELEDEDVDFGVGVEGGSEIGDNNDINSSVKIIESQNDFNKTRVTKRSKNGCLTCKIRKKKCSETRPACDDCKRLNKGCIWVDNKMTEEELKELKEKVEKEESLSKLRKRKSKRTILFTENIHYNNSMKFRFKERNGVIDSKKSNFENGRTCAFSKRSSSDIEVNPEPSNKKRLNNSNTVDLDGVIMQEQLANPKSKLSSPSIGYLINSTSNLDDEIKEQLFTTETNISSPSISYLVNSSNASLNKESIKVSDTYEASSENSMSASPGFLNFLNELCNNQQEREDDKTKINYDNNELVKSLIPNILLSDRMNTSEQALIVDEYLANMNHSFNPSPSPTLSTIPDMHDFNSFLYNYYVDILSNKMSIAPISQNESNSYQKVFLPLAQKDKGVMYGILAWSAFHLGGKWTDEGSKYAKQALDHINRTVKTLNGSYDKNREIILSNLAALLILCGAEICNGDVKNWTFYLKRGWKLLFENGGILNFNNTKEEYWLISNFAYHDLLASPSTKRSTYFSSKDYDLIFKDINGFSRGNLSPLLGICKRLHRIIGDISMLSFELKNATKTFEIQNTYTEPDLNDLNTSSEQLENKSLKFETDDINQPNLEKILQKVIEKANLLEQEIDTAKPDSSDLIDLTLEELELQLTLFEAFQLSAKLFLKQSILNCNPTMLVSRLLNADLVKCLDILLDSPVQSSLVFPIFIAGIHSITPRDRQMMKVRITKFIDSYGPWNVKRIEEIVEMVWKQNENGDKVVDWQSILDDINWDINFA